MTVDGPASAAAGLDDLLGDAPSGGLFRLEAGPLRDRQLRVARFRGRERVNGLYEFEVEAAAHRVDLTTVAPLLLGQAASLSFGHAPGRVAHGVVTAVEFDGLFTGTAVPRLRLRLSPRAKLLKRTRNSRIFQGKTVREIVSAVLAEHGVAHHWRLVGAYPQRDYCLQYRESDWAFVTRLLAEEGIYFFFRHPDVPLSELAAPTPTPAGTALGPTGEVLAASEVLVLADRADAAFAIASTDGAPSSAAAPPALAVRDDDGMLPQEHYLARFSTRRAVREKSVLHRRYEFRQPRLDVRGEAAVPAAPPGAPQPLGAALDHDAPLALDPAGLRHYDHNVEDEPVEPGRPRAQTRLEQLRADRTVGRGRSWCPRLLPGHRFAVEEAGLSELEGAYTVTAVTHEGDAAASFPDERAEHDRRQSYRNRFECVPAAAAPRPPPPAPSLRQVMEPARVVGPPGEEIYTDEFGRIKVQFFWDNAGRFDAFSSCWIRVIQAWAGGAWGFQFIPRVGMEVMVSFQYGDHDRPVVVGAVYNGENAAPFGLPGDRTRSGIRTQSSPGGAGYNELSFQDQAGRELVHLRAQRDLDESVGHDHTRAVAHDERVSVRNDRETDVARDLRELVGRHRSTSVRGEQSEVIGAGRTLRVGGSDHVLTQGQAFYTTLDNYNLQVGRVLNTYVGSEREPGSTNFWSWGPTRWGSDDGHTLHARQKITLQVGESRLELTPDAIVLSAPRVVVAAAEEAVVRGPGPALTLNDVACLVASEVKVQSPGVTMKLDDAAFRVEAPAHVLTSGTGAATEERRRVPSDTKPFRLRLSNAQFEPYANRPYELTVGTLRLTGTTDGAGEINEDVPADAARATVQLWVGDPPTGASRIFQVELVEAIPPASSVSGAKMRLAHLGYYRGEVDGAEDPGLAEAVRQFQQDHEMEITGAHADVAARLEEVHGS